MTAPTGAIKGSDLGGDDVDAELVVARCPGRREADAKDSQEREFDIPKVFRLQGHAAMLRR